MGEYEISVLMTIGAISVAYFALFFICEKIFMK